MLTAPQKLMQLVLYRATEGREKRDDPAGVEARLSEIEEDPDGVELRDVEEGIRGGEYETDIAPAYSRHYVTKSVAAKMLDGSWVGWTYYYGGGKHGSPWSVPWIDDAYDLDMKEEVVTQTVRKFTKIEPEE